MVEPAAQQDALTAELLAELEATRGVDTHEHLMPEAERLQKDADFFSLFEHYCPGDLVAAGVHEQEMADLADRSIPEEERWRRFKPYLSRIRTGSYARAALWVVRDLLGLPDLDDETFREAGRRLRELLRPGVYDYVLRERCNLAACIQCVQLQHMGPDYFYHLAPAGDLVDFSGVPAVKAFGERLGRDIGGLNDLLEHMDAHLARWGSDRRVVGIKVGHAYVRSLEFRPVERADAEGALRRILAAGREGDPDDVRALQDFLMFELAAHASEAGLPIVIHTGLQAGNYGRIADADPLLLQALIAKNPRTKFDLYHGGMPWVRQIAVLAKYFPNVYLNMAWMHIISPAQARSALAEWLDMVPNSKVFGFGGDYSIVEKVYGHLKIARENIARVLAAKVRQGAWRRPEASLVARRLMRENAVEFYGLSLDDEQAAPW
ncbi:MAG: hypothetical protein AMK73_07820 [Planctomycetes bacterium SM23_32]|nr:MAG: hypothetical protein AMK73_07820 [Planctomycetes bacterium SM23_32]